MERNNIFSGISGAFWSLTFALIGFNIFAASVGGDGLLRVLLAVNAVYCAIGIAYGTWAARNAVRQANIR